MARKARSRSAARTTPAAALHDEYFGVLLEAFRAHGVRLIDTLIADDPLQFLKLVAGATPKEDHDNPKASRSESEVDTRLAHVARQLLLLEAREARPDGREGPS